MRAGVLVALVCALALAVGGARALGDPVGGECEAIQGAAGEYAPAGMTKQVKVGLMVTWKGKWNNFSVGNCRAAMTWLRLVKEQGGITTKGGGLLGIKLYVVDVSAETAPGNGVLSVGGTKTPTYEMGKQFITDNGLDVSLTPYSSSLSPYAGRAGHETNVPVVATGAAAETVFACPECDDAADCAAKAFGCAAPNTRRYNELFGVLSVAGTYFRDFVSLSSIKGAKRVAFVYEINKSFTYAMVVGAKTQATNLKMEIIADITMAEQRDADLCSGSDPATMCSDPDGLITEADAQTGVPTVVSKGSSWTDSGFRLVPLLKHLNTDLVIGGTYPTSCTGLVMGFRQANYLPKGLGLSTCMGSVSMFTTLGKDMRWLAGPSQWDRRLTGRDFEESKYTVPNHFQKTDDKTSPQQMYEAFQADHVEPPIYQATAALAGFYLIEAGLSATTSATPTPVELTAALKSVYSPSFWGIATTDAFGKNERRVPVTWAYGPSGTLEVLTPLSAATAEYKYPLPAWDSLERNYPCPAGEKVIGKNDWSDDSDAFIANGAASWDSTSCEACPAGSFSASVGSLECTVCPDGHYSTSAKSTECIKCPDGATCSKTGLLAPVCGPGEGAGAERCYTCPSGEYNLNGDGVCRQCPQGAVCSGGTGVALLKDYWVSPASITAGAIDVYRCRPGWCCEDARCPIFKDGDAASCTGGANDGIGRDACSVATCAPKKMGTLCGACAPGHVLVGEQCEADCDGFGAGPFVFMLFLAFLAVFALLAFPHGEIVTETGVFTDGMIKVFANYFNIIQLLEFSASTAVSTLLSINSDSVTNITGSCMFETNPLGNLMLGALLPIVMLLALGFIALLDFIYQNLPGLHGTVAPIRERWVVYWYKVMKGVDDTGRIPEKEINWWSKYVYVFLQLSIFCHSTITVTALRMFQCRTVAGDDVLAFSPSVKCHEGAHKTFFIVAIILLVCYVIPLPFIAVYMAYKTVGSYLKEHGDKSADYTDSDEYYRTVRTYGPLWIGYRAGCWWYELVNLLRRILIIGLFVGLDSPEVRPEQDGFVSKAFMAAFCLILCIAHMVIQPFETAMDNHVEGFMLAALTAVPITDYARTRASYEDSDSFIAVEAVMLYFPVFAGVCGYFSRRYNKTSDEQKIISKAEA